MSSKTNKPLLSRVFGAKNWPEAAAKVSGLALLTHTVSKSVVTNGSREIIYQPIAVSDLSQLPSRQHIERLHRKIPEGQVEAWFIPARGTSEPAPLVVFAHGNSAINDWWAPLLEPYADAGFNVLMVEYRGYGHSGGRPTQRAIVSDIVHFYDQAVARPDVDKSRVYFHGHSLGAAVVAQLARFRPATALVLQAPFTSVPDLAKKMSIPRAWLADKWDTRRALALLPAPILVFHGRRDEIIPIEHGRRVASAARRATLVELDCGHNDCKIQWPRVFEFYEEHAS